MNPESRSSTGRRVVVVAGGRVLGGLGVTRLVLGTADVFVVGVLGWWLRAVGTTPPII